MIQVRIGTELLTLSWEAFEERVRAGRIPPEAEICWEPVTGTRFVRASELETYRSLHNESLMDWQRRFSASPPPIFTALLVGVQVRIWWLSHIPSWRQWLEVSFTKWTPMSLENGEVWRILTMGVLHTDGLHLTMNMMWLAYTAWNLEVALGWRNLACLFFGSVAGGSLLSMWGSPVNPSLGASGGVFGLIAAAVVFGFIRPEILPDRARRFFGFAMFPYLLMMFFSGIFNATTDNWCHLGGLLTGALLATMLDPPPLERRPRHNRDTHLGVTSVVFGIMSVLALGGPRLTPLDTPSSVTRASVAARSAGRTVPILDDAEYLSVTYQAPLGWRAGASLDRLTGFRSPAGPRVWSVEESVRVKPATLEDERSRRRDALERAGIELLDWTSSDVSIQGDRATEVRATVRADDVRMNLTWTIRIRGRYVLVTGWQVEEAAAVRLAPLAARLLAAVTWRDPAPLHLARLAVTRNPNNPDYQRRLATSLAAIGQPDEAMDILDQLAKTNKPDRRLWEARLEILRSYPQRPDTMPLVAEALASDLGSTVVRDAVAVLEARGEHELGRAVLDLAWSRTPGDRILRTARRGRRMSVTLHPTLQLPAADCYDAWTARTVSATMRELPPNLDDARQLAADRRALRQHLIERLQRQLDTGDPGLAATLTLLAAPHPVEEPQVTWGKLKQELLSDTPPAWLVEADVSLPALLEAITTLPEAEMIDAIPTW